MLFHSKYRSRPHFAHESMFQDSLTADRQAVRRPSVVHSLCLHVFYLFCLQIFCSAHLHRPRKNMTAQARLELYFPPAELHLADSHFVLRAEFLQAGLL